MAIDNSLIRFDGVSFYYEPSRPVLESIDFSLTAGDRIGLIGPNGSGKTSLLHLIVGLIYPTAGEIYAFGKVRRKDKDFIEVRALAGLLFQDAEDQLFSPTVLEDVAFGPLNLGKGRAEARRIASETLEMLGLAGFEERVTYRLSGGQKRLVSLATVLAMKPEVLLLDEPNSGLDEDSVERLIEILTGLPQAMIIVSHDRDFLRKTTNNIMFLQNGRLESYGSTVSR
jgi:cobalt/nickel transport system ATP-binding protein